MLNIISYKVAENDKQKQKIKVFQYIAEIKQRLIIRNETVIQ